MKHVLILLIAVKTIYGFGFAANMPFHMQFEIPAFPAMNAMPMPFPPIFNPMEATQGDTVDPEARGMDADGPMGNVTTKNSTEVKDGFKITTITRNGPGFHSYIKEYEKEGNGTTNGTKGVDLMKMMGGSNLFTIMQQLRNAGRKQKEKKCGKCGKGKFCDPIFHLCRKKFAEGRTCMFQKQCGKSLRCQWGKCQKAKPGDPGTFCKGNSQCNGEACCRNTPGSFHLMCIPRQSEGAICGLKKESFADVLYVVKRSVAPTCSPCESGLKCADTGDGQYKKCVKKDYVEKAADEMEDDNPSNALDDDNNDDDDASAKGPDPIKGIPPKGTPNTESKNPIQDEGGNKWQPGPENPDEDDDDDEDEKEEEDNSGDDDNEDEGQDAGIAVQKPPKKGKGKGKKDKSKTKEKSR